MKRERASPATMKAPAALALAAFALLALTPPAQAATLEFPVYLHEFTDTLHVVPDQINANKGDTVQLTVLNQGIDRENGLHDLLVCGDSPSSGSACSDVWGATPKLVNNQTFVLTFDAKEAGTFSYYCTLPGHRAAGMAGRLVVFGEPEREAGGGAVLGALLALGSVALARRRR